MHPSGFEPTNPASEQAKTVHDLDHAATVISRWMVSLLKYSLRILISSIIAMCPKVIHLLLNKLTVLIIGEGFV
jgi:hypothetical protein